MAFSNYADFRVAVQSLIDSELSTEATFSTNILDTLIGLAEDRVYLGDPANPGLRASTMIQPLTLTATAGVATLPTDLLELRKVGTTTDKPLEIVPLPDMPRYAGTSPVCAQDGETLVFTANYSGPIVGRYYARPAALKTALNSTFNRYPALFLYASLIESALFVGRTDMADAWGMRYAALARAASSTERWRVYDGSRLRVKAR